MDTVSNGPGTGPGIGGAAVSMATSLPTHADPGVSAAALLGTGVAGVAGVTGRGGVVEGVARYGLASIIGPTK